MFFESVKIRFFQTWRPFFIKVTHCNAFTAIERGINLDLFNLRMLRK